MVGFEPRCCTSDVSLRNLAGTSDVSFKKFCGYVQRTFGRSVILQWKRHAGHPGINEILSQCLQSHAPLLTSCHQRRICGCTLVGEVVGGGRGKFLQWLWWYSTIQHIIIVLIILIYCATMFSYTPRGSRLAFLAAARKTVIDNTYDRYNYSLRYCITFR